MKKTSFFKNVAIVGICILTLGVCTGCSDKETSMDSETNTKVAYNKAMSKDSVDDEGIVNDAVLLTVGEDDVTYSEVMVYLLMMKQNYEGIFSESVWSFSFNDNETFEDLAKEKIINQISRIKVTSQGAEKLGIEVEPDEKLVIEDNALQYISGISEADQKKYGITLEIVESIFRDNFLAEKAYDVVTSDVDTEVSDEESRVVGINQIAILFNGKDKNGNDIKLTKEEAYEMIKKAQKEVKEGKKDFLDIAKNYSNISEIELSLVRSESEEVYENAAFSLKKGKYSNIIETSTGYYILYCTSESKNNNAEANIASIIEKRQESAFVEKYVEWLKNVDVFIVMELWNMIEFSSL